MVDMFFYRDPEEVEREALEAKALASAEQGGTAEIGGEAAAAVASDWEVANSGAGGAAAAAAANIAGGAGGDGNLDWAAEPGASDWAADASAQPAAAPAASGWE